MKKTLLITFIGITIGVKAQHVDLNNSTDYIRIQKNGESDFSRAFGLNSSNHMYIGSVEKTIGNIYFFNKGAGHLMTLTPNGNMGIGTTNPNSTLQIGDSENTGGPNIEVEKKRLSIAPVTHSSSDWFFTTRDNIPYANLDIGYSNNKTLTLRHDGNVGIGSTNPDSKLSVNGKIHTKEVKVDLIGWSDFVFKKDYNLPTLQQVEIYIKAKGHLKDIPSAKDVEENGIYLGEMDSKLLQKIEELTLYTIQQQKEIEILKEEKKELKSINTKLLQLQIRLEKLENK
ncbi:hypothetical protein [Olleya sp. Bg11-27]|uniref:hypothetical protein n=1 Tax=Olleya sp. Bg11-27 TaxID=2058135 RepID=UPI0012FDD617|nr:hypothetical protein [Olleya sp. Bg11-27]